MKIKYINIKNFRALKNVKIDLEKDLSVIIGKNNTGKTSLLLVLEEFLSNNPNFEKEDFNNEIWGDDKPFISLELCIEYDDNDDLLLLNPFFCSLDANNNKIFLEFKYEAKADDFKLNNLSKNDNIKDNFQLNIYSKEKENEKYLNKCDIKDIIKLINFKYIRASRCIKEQENNNVSNLAKNYYENSTKNDLKKSNINDFNNIVNKTNTEFTEKYKEFFQPFFKTMDSFNFQDINGQNNLSIKSNIKINSLISDNTSIIYKNDENFEIPEGHNGLGYTNLLFLCLKIKEFCDTFKKEEKAINLLFVEEPEAHMHPQMQYVFMENIKNFISNQNVSNLQTMITSHSPYVVSRTSFNNLKYFNYYNNSIKANNCSELENSETDNIKFVKKYLEIDKYEMFFADYVIMVEGNTEKILMPYFIKQIDKTLLNKNISIIEIGGAHAHKFKKFLEFLKIKTLIITDLDFKIDTNDKMTIQKYDDIKGKETTNSSLISLADGKNIEGIMKGIEKFNKENNSLLHLVTQKTHKDYDICRSFEEDFIKSNFKFFKENKNKISILKNIVFDDGQSEFSNEEIKKIRNKIENKIDFALDIMCCINDEANNFNVPEYIKGGIGWIKTK